MPDHGAMEWKASLVVSQSSESNVRFASFVEEIRTDTSGYVIGKLYSIASGIKLSKRCLQTAKAVTWSG